MTRADTWLSEAELTELAQRFGHPDLAANAGAEAEALRARAEGHHAEAEAADAEQEWQRVRGALSEHYGVAL